MGPRWVPGLQRQRGHVTSDERHTRLTVWLELPASVREGAPVGGRLVIANEGEEPLSLASPGSTAALTFVAFDNLWNSIPPESLGKVHVAPEILDVPPGRRHVWEFRDLVAVSGTSSTVIRLPPGRFYIFAVYHPGTARLPERSEYPVIAVSDVATVTIDPRGREWPTT